MTPNLKKKPRTPTTKSSNRSNSNERSQRTVYSMERTSDNRSLFSGPNKYTITDNSITSITKNPYSKSSKNSKKLKKLKELKSFDDRLTLISKCTPNPVLSLQNRKMSEQNTQSTSKLQRFNGNQIIKGILRRQSYKLVKRSNYSKQKDEKKRENSIDSNLPTLDSLKKKPDMSKNIIYNDNAHEVELYTGRNDSFGHPIIRGRRKHKIEFDTNLLFIDVENWKDRNFKNSYRRKKNKGCAVCRAF